MLSFTVPYAMFLEMEENVEGSFLTKTQWQMLNPAGNITIAGKG
jgi:hypothetical protein